MESWILQMCRRSSLRQVVAWAVVITAALIFLLANTRYLANFVSGPFDFSTADLEQVKDVTTTPRYFVRVTGTKTLESGVSEITTTKRGEVEVERRESAKYYWLIFGSKALLVKHPTSQATVVEGALKPIPPDVMAELFDTPQMAADVESKMYPFYLDVVPFRAVGYLGIVIAVALIFLLLIYVPPTWRTLQNPTSHPVMRRVSHWGDPLSISQEVQRENEGGRPLRLGNHTITDNYLIETSFFGFELLRVGDILWSYKTVTKHSFNLIPTGTTYVANLICYNGTAHIKATEARVNSLLEYVAKKVPWAFSGYSEEIDNFYRTRKDEFSAAVHGRKRDMELEDLGTKPS